MTITIITACFNSATTIRTALESVLAQTWPEIEYLVIDGGSTDGTVGIIRQYEKKFVSSFVRECVSEKADACADEQTRQYGNKALRQFVWLSEPDEGMYDAINKGIRMATGEVVGILNADDVLSADDVIERVAEAFGNCVSADVRDGMVCDNKAIGHSGNKAKCPPGCPDAIYGDIRFVANREGVGLEGLRAERTVRYYSARHWHPWMLQWGFMPPHPSVYIRRECFEKLGGYALDYRIAADYALLIRYLRRAELRCRYLPMCFVDMRVGGMSTKNWRSNLLLNREIVRGNRESGYFCCLPMLVPKYAFKIFEFVVPRMRNSLPQRRKVAKMKNMSDRCT